VSGSKLTSGFSDRGAESAGLTVRLTKVQFTILEPIRLSKRTREKMDNIGKVIGWKFQWIPSWSSLLWGYGGSIKRLSKSCRRFRWWGVSFGSWTIGISKYDNKPVPSEYTDRKPAFDDEFAVRM